MTRFEANMAACNTPSADRIGLAQRQVKEQSERERSPDGDIRIEPLAAAFPGLWSGSCRDRRLTEPERDVTAIA